MTTNLNRPLPDFVAWVIIADDEIDQICGSLTEAKRECKDLREMGCTVKRLAFGTWAEAEAFADKWRDNALPWNTKVPATLNGFPVIAFQEHANGYVTVMMNRSVPHTPYTDLIVATWWQDLGDQWQWGHYDLSSARDADAKFKDVAKRNSLR